MTPLRLANPRSMDLDYARVAERDSLLAAVLARSGGATVQWEPLSRDGCGRLYVGGTPTCDWASCPETAMRRYLANTL